MYSELKTYSYNLNCYGLSAFIEIVGVIDEAEPHKLQDVTLETTAPIIYWQKTANIKISSVITVGVASVRHDKYEKAI